MGRWEEQWQEAPLAQRLFALRLAGCWRSCRYECFSLRYAWVRQRKPTARVGLAVCVAVQPLSSIQRPCPSSSPCINCLRVIIILFRPFILAFQGLKFEPFAATKTKTKPTNSNKHQHTFHMYIKK